MKALLIAAQGDPEAKLTVKRSWLTEVYRLLVEGQRAKAELVKLKSQLAQQKNELDAMSDFTDGLENGSFFDSLFGKKKR